MRSAPTCLTRVACMALLCVGSAMFAQDGQIGQAKTAATQQAGAPQAVDAKRSDLPPSSILAETLAPFEQTRADIANWSAIELAAFQKTTAQAKAECRRLEQTPHEGEEALALARLCSIGMEWDSTYSAARWYTRAAAPAGEATHLALGFGLLLQADLNLQAVQRAIDNLAEMNRRVPFSADTDSVFSYVVSATEVMRPDYGLQAGLMRQPALLEVVSGIAASTTVAAGVAESEAWHTLMLLHLAHRGSDEAAETSRLLEAKAKRATPLSTVDSYVAAQGRKQYEWLGKPAPVSRLRSSPASVKKSDQHPAVELVVIERESASDVPLLTGTIGELRKRLPKNATASLTLIADVPTSDKQKAPTPQPNIAYTDEDLFAKLGFGNGPLFLLKDQQGRVTYLSAGAAAWLNPQMQAETLIERA
ncbi:MAG: hypothetical protein ACRYGF_06695, partial [Janthinobacterium lividum]